MHEVRRRVHFGGRRRRAASLLDDPITRALLAVAAVLTVAVGLANLPFYGEPAAVGWRAGSSYERISLYSLRPEDEEEPAPDPHASAMTATAQFDALQSPEEKDASLEDDTSAASQTVASSGTDSLGTAANDQRENPLEVFELTGRQPDVEGGMGTLYLHVDYPMAAREQGIEGRVILRFIVNEEGSVHDVEVQQSAHPLLDSAAVRAVQDTRFTPGRHNGEPVSVRMRLPIRFQLVN